MRYGLITTNSVIQPDRCKKQCYAQTRQQVMLIAYYMILIESSGQKLAQSPKNHVVLTLFWRL